jgi:hypothetical protein
LEYNKGDNQRKTFWILVFIPVLLLFFINCSRNKNEIDADEIIYECTVDIDTIDFTFGIDYDNPEKYLIPGEQSNLSDENFEKIKNAIGTINSDIQGILKVCNWINQHFTFENAGGNMAGKNTVDELFTAKTFYGCHSLALIISSILRKYGIPAVMIETADIQWAYEYRTGSIEYFAGHVMSEVFLNNQWILLDNNCTYVLEYEHKNPFVPVINPNEKGMFVFAKGTDIWDYRNNNDSYTYDKLIDFSKNLVCYEELFYTVDYTWKN